jgi:hypothetical protein
MGATEIQFAAKLQLWRPRLPGLRGERSQGRPTAKPSRSAPEGESYNINAA